MTFLFVDVLYLLLRISFVYNNNSFCPRLYYTFLHVWIIQCISISLSHCTISFSIMHQVMGMKPLSLLYHIVCNHHLFQLPKWIFRPQVVIWLQKTIKYFISYFYIENFVIRSPMIFVCYQIAFFQISLGLYLF